MMLITSFLRSTKKMKSSAGIQMSEEELAEYNKTFSDIEESIKLVMENGEHL